MRQGQTNPTKFIEKDTNLCCFVGPPERNIILHQSTIRSFGQNMDMYILLYLNLSKLGNRQPLTYAAIKNRDNVGMKWTDTPTNYHHQGDFIGYNFVEDSY